MTLLLDLSEGAGISRHKWTRAEYDQMFEIGLLTPEDHCELIEGEIVDKMPQNWPHIQTCLRVQGLLMQLYGLDRVPSQSSVALDERNRPEPDVAVLNRSANELTNLPTPTDILLVVEISNTTQRFDTNVTAAVYARTDIPEYWIINIVARTLLVLRDPTPEGYTSRTTLTETETVSPLSAPNAVLSVAQMLPPVTPVEEG